MSSTDGMRVDVVRPDQAGGLRSVDASWTSLSTISPDYDNMESDSGGDRAVKGRTGHHKHVSSDADSGSLSPGVSRLQERLKRVSACSVHVMEEA